MIVWRPSDRTATRDHRPSTIDHRSAAIDHRPADDTEAFECLRNRCSARRNVAPERRIQRSHARDQISLARKRSRLARTQEVSPRSHARDRTSLAPNRSSDGMHCLPPIVWTELRSISENPCRSIWGHVSETVVARMPLMAWKTCHTAQTST